MRNPLKVLLVLATLSCLPAHAVPTAASDPPEAAIANLAMELGVAAQTIRGFRALVDDARFALMPAIEDLDFDGGQLVRFVTEAVHFDPYSGILRGPQATLSARAGNAIDQSLLLQRLLEQAGYDAQIVMVDQAPDSLAAPLAAAAVAGRAQPLPVRNAEAARAWLADLAEGAGQAQALDTAAAAWQPAVPADIDQTVRSLGAQLQDALAPAAGRAVEQGGYHWVRYRAAPGMSWTHAHPALGGAAPDNLAPDRVLTGSAPEEMLHFLTIEMDAEILERGALRRIPLMRPWQQPVADLFGTPIAIALAVDPGGTDTAAGASFMPVLHGAPAPGAIRVTLGGAVLDAAVATLDRYGMSGLFAALGDQLQDGAQRASGDAEDQPVRATTGVILRVIWTAPDGSRRVEERWILDRLANRDAAGAAPRLDLSLTRSEVLHRLSFQRDLIVNPGGAHRAFALAQSLETFDDRLVLLSAVLDQAIGNAGRIDHAPPARRSLQPFLLSMLDSFDQPLALPEGTTVYRHGPLVVSTHRHRQERGERGDYIDVLFNPWSGARREGEALLAWPEGSLLRGVHDTAVEVAFGSGDPDGDYLARSGDAPLRYLHAPADVAAWPQDARLAAEHDLGQGFVLAAIADGEALTRWWRIAPDGAETLGRSALGGQVGERAAVDTITRAGDFFSWSMLLFGAAQCGQRDSGWPKACCYASLASSYAVGWGAGNLIIGSATSGAAATTITTGSLLAVAVLQLGIVTASETVGAMHATAACGA
jgi:hypothetical protein